MSFKKSHKQQDIKRQLSILIRSLKSSSLDSKQISVTNILTNSKSLKITVFISSLKGPIYAKQALEPLKKASGFLKRELSKNLRLKKAPQLEFLVDNSLQYFEHLKELFLKIKKEVKKVEN